MDPDARMRWWVVTRDKPGLLWALLDHFVSNATVSFEGRLAALGLSDMVGAASEETLALRRQERKPRLDFVTLPVTPETTGILKKRLAAPGLFRYRGPIVHVQIEHAGQLVLLAGDHFHRECVSVFSPVSEQLLEDLRSSGVIRSYRADDRRRR